MPNPYIIQYARQPWMMEPSAAKLFFSSLAEIQITASLAQVNVDVPLPIKVTGDTAVIPISGVLVKHVPDALKLYFGSRVTGYDDIREMTRLAVENPTVERIELRITSPGGMVAGGMETAEAIRAADTAKPVTAVIEDLGASGAFWLALSARRIEANANAEVGSIGVYTYYLDWTAFDEKLGIKTVVIRSGPHKGMGLDTITDEQIAAMQEVIDGMNSHFIDQVAAGRHVDRERASEWATGRIWLAPAALNMGLIDAITPFESAPNPNQQKEQIMAEPEKQETSVDAEAVSKAAAEDAVTAERKRVADLKAAFPSDPGFALEAIEAGWNVTEAKAARHDRIENEIAETPKGDNGVPYHDSDGGSGVDFMVQAKQIAREQKISMTEAMRQVQSEDPESYERFLAAESRRTLRNRGGKQAAGRVTL